MQLPWASIWYSTGKSVHFTCTKYYSVWKKINKMKTTKRTSYAHMGMYCNHANCLNFQKLSQTSLAPDAYQLRNEERLFHGRIVH